MQAELDCRPVLRPSVYQQPKRLATDADYLGSFPADLRALQVR